MGSPVSVVVAEIVMQHVEESTLTTCRQKIPLCLRYVDDTAFTAVIIFLLIITERCFYLRYQGRATTVLSQGSVLNAVLGHLEYFLSSVG